MYAVKMPDGFCRQLGLERTFLQAEPETQPLTVANAVCGKRTHLLPRESPTNSKGSLGEVERDHRSVEGDARTLRAHVIARYGVEMSHGSSHL